MTTPDLIRDWRDRQIEQDACEKYRQVTRRRAESQRRASWRFGLLIAGLVALYAVAAFMSAVTRDATRLTNEREAAKTASVSPPHSPVRVSIPRQGAFHKELR